MRSLCPSSSGMRRTNAESTKAAPGFLSAQHSNTVIVRSIRGVTAVGARMPSAMFTAAAASPPIAFRHTSIVEEMLPTQLSSCALRVSSKASAGRRRHHDSVWDHAGLSAAGGPDFGSVLITQASPFAPKRVSTAGWSIEIREEKPLSGLSPCHAGP